jgi:hypothetical protein
MEDRELVSIIAAYRHDSLGYDDGDLANERENAMNHYHGRAYGDEKQNRSQVVSKDLSETVDWAMPAIMKVFVQSGNIAEFIPTTAESENQTQLESDYVNQVIMQDNNGFLVLHDAVKDALLLKNGYFKHYWSEIEKIVEEEYEDLTPDELVRIYTELSERGEIEVVEQEEIMVLGPQGYDISTYRVKFQIKEVTAQCVIEAVPPEEVRISKRCRGSLQESNFTEHVTRKTRTQLIEMGMDQDFVYSLAAYDSTTSNDGQRYARDSVVDESDDYIGTSNDKSMNEIDFCEAYVRVDYDDDGIAELRKVVTVNDKIPPGDDWNEKIDAVPMTGMVPKRIPHRHIGESLDDDLEDLQRIKTVLTRSLLDNAYLNNNQEWLVNERVNLSDFLKSTPGGLKRVKGEQPVDGSASPVAVTPIINQILPAIAYIDQVKGDRTGIDRTTTMIDPDVLKQSTAGAIAENVNRASQKIEMITRVLAESGVKELVIRVQEILRAHQKDTITSKIRGQFQEVTPSQWPERKNAKVIVGIGTGTEEEKQQKLAFLSQEQQKLAQMGLVMPIHAFNLFQDQARAMGFDMPEKYAANPQSKEFQQYQQMQAQQQQGQPNPLAEAEQVKGQFKLQSDQMIAQVKMQMKQMEEANKAQTTQLREQHKHEMDMQKQQVDERIAEADRLSRETIAAAQLEIKAMIEGMKVDVGKPGIGAGLQRTYDPSSGTLV